MVIGFRVQLLVCVRIVACFRGKLFTMKLLTQGYKRTKVVSILKKFYVSHHDLVSPYNVSVPRLIADVFTTAKA